MSVMDISYAMETTGKYIKHTITTKLEPNTSVLFHVEGGENIVTGMCKNFCAQWAST